MTRCCADRGPPLGRCNFRATWRLHVVRGPLPWVYILDACDVHGYPGSSLFIERRERL